ncbi:MAG: type II toxin-antitoxin system RelB/DinJ family antitoxin [Spirochaetaceae bacterium]|nr:type II toxin-antitoxin system RelB/DinJ family antitoxin [Spirochaetaceae bacterium]
MATLSIRMNDETKMAFEGFCESVGLTVSAAVNMFAKITLRQNRIPFEVEGDPFWSEENQARLRESIQHAREGKLTKHEISEVD